MNYGPLNNLNIMLKNIEADLGTIALTVAGCVFLACCIGILLTTDNTPAGRKDRWDKLILVFIITGLIGGFGVILNLAHAIGVGLGGGR